ncbi:CapA family protein [Wukongibacter baidiensis]|uniref:CapA family protein n=1 Tax=Wukongibacter baidiensis TaxID=1723361 RepID=UPI003D7FB1A1
MIEKAIMTKIILSIMVFTSVVSPKEGEVNLNRNLKNDQVYQLILENDEFKSFNELVDKGIAKELEKARESRIERIQIASVGDIMCHSPQYRSVYKDEKYDFTSWFIDVKQYIEGADIAIANLETTFSGPEKKYSGYPQFNTPKALGTALKEAGFDIITTANNHSLDRRNHGIVATLNELDKLQLRHTGTYRNDKEQEDILIEDVKGIKIAIMNYTYGTNGISIPKENPSAVNIINREKMLSDINKAMEQEADLIIFSLHFGQEYQRKQNKNQEDLVDFLFENGVDIVLGSHPHVIQPVDFKEVKRVNGENKNCFVIYSQGNFISNQRKRYTDSGLITILNIEKNFETKETNIEDYSFVPTWVDRSYYKNRLDYRILPVEKGISNYEERLDGLISEEDYRRLNQVLEETKEQIK